MKNEFTLSILSPIRKKKVTPSLRLSSQAAYINAYAAKAIGLKKGGRAALALTPGKELYIGSIPPKNADAGYSVCSASGKGSLAFNCRSAVKAGVKPGAYSITGSSKNYAGSTWFLLTRLAD